MKANLKKTLPQEGTGYSLAGESLGGPSGSSCPAYSGGGQDRYRYRAPRTTEDRNLKQISQNCLLNMQNSQSLNLIFDKDREVEDMASVLHTNLNKMCRLEDQTSFALQEHILEAVMIVEKVASFAVGPQDQKTLNDAVIKIKEVLMDVIIKETKQIKTRSQLLLLRRELIEKKEIIQSRKKSNSIGDDFGKQIHPAGTDKDTEQRTEIKKEQTEPFSSKVGLLNTELILNRSCVAFEANNLIVAAGLRGNITDEKAQLIADQKSGDMVKTMPINELGIGTMEDRVANITIATQENEKQVNKVIDINVQLEELQKLSGSTTMRQQMQKTTLLDIHNLPELTTTEGLAPRLTFDGQRDDKKTTEYPGKYVHNTQHKSDLRIEKSLGNENVETKQLCGRLESMSGGDDMKNQIHCIGSDKEPVQKTLFKKDLIELHQCTDGGSKTELIISSNCVASEIKNTIPAKQHGDVINDNLTCETGKPPISILKEPGDTVPASRINQLKIGTTQNREEMREVVAQENEKLRDTAIDIKNTLEELRKLSDSTRNRRQVQKSTLLEMYKLSELTAPGEGLSSHIMLNDQLDSNKKTGFIGKYEQSTKKETEIQKYQIVLPSKGGGSETELNFDRNSVPSEVHNYTAAGQPGFVINKHLPCLTMTPQLSNDQESVDLVQGLNKLEIGKIEDYAPIKQKDTKEIQEKLENPALDIKHTVVELQNLSDSIKSRQAKKIVLLDIQETRLSDLIVPTKGLASNITIEEEVDGDKLTYFLENYVQNTKQGCGLHKDTSLQKKNVTNKKKRGGKRSNEVRTPLLSPEPAYELWYVEDLFKELALKRVECNKNNVKSVSSNSDDFKGADGEMTSSRDAVCSRPKPYWWSTEIEELRRGYIAARRQLSKSRRRKLQRDEAAEAQLYTVFRAHKRSLRRAIAKAKAKRKPRTSEST